MIIVFKRAKGSGLVSQAIDLLSGRDGYCHVEIVFDDGMSFSSTTLDDGPSGVRFRRINYSNPDTWTFYDVPTTRDQEETIRAKAAKLAGAPYDHLGVIRFVVPWMKEHPTRYFCSEVCLTAFQAAGLFLELGDPWRVPPNLWARHLRQAGYVSIPGAWTNEEIRT